jgi:hypothetical protein
VPRVVAQPAGAHRIPEEAQRAEVEYPQPRLLGHREDLGGEAQGHDREAHLHRAVLRLRAVHLEEDHGVQARLVRPVARAVGLEEAGRRVDQHLEVHDQGRLHGMMQLNI